jgi:hypothetical protein
LSRLWATSTRADGFGGAIPGITAFDLYFGFPRAWRVNFAVRAELIGHNFGGTISGVKKGNFPCKFKKICNSKYVLKSKFF